MYDVKINTPDTLASLPVVDTTAAPTVPADAEEVGFVQVGEGPVADVTSVVL